MLLQKAVFHSLFFFFCLSHSSLYIYVPHLDTSISLWTLPLIPLLGYHIINYDAVNVVCMFPFECQVFFFFFFCIYVQEFDHRLNFLWYFVKIHIYLFTCLAALGLSSSTQDLYLQNANS